jgi:hypothetical protein
MRRTNLELALHTRLPRRAKTTNVQITHGRIETMMPANQTAFEQALH